MEKISIVKRRKADDGNTEKYAEGSFQNIVEQVPTGNNANAIIPDSLIDARSTDKIDLQDVKISGNIPYEVKIEKKETEDRKIILNLNFEPLQSQRMLSINDVCMMLKISRNLLRKLIRDKKIECYRIGRLKRFLLDDVLSYIQRSKVL